MADRLRVVHYLNQFFGGIGAEEHANIPIQVRDGPVGPARILDQALGDVGSVVATIIGGDNYVVEESDSASKEVADALKRLEPSVVVAGPAFDAGRYGMACGLISHVASGVGIPTVTAMHPDNAGVAVHGREMIVVPSGIEALEMVDIIKRMVPLAIKMGRGEELGPAEVEAYLAPNSGKRRVIQKANVYQIVVPRAQIHVGPADWFADNINHCGILRKLTLDSYYDKKYGCGLWLDEAVRGTVAEGAAWSFGQARLRLFPRLLGPFRTIGIE